jgi:hypothetical protein
VQSSGDLAAHGDRTGADAPGLPVVRAPVSQVVGGACAQGIRRPSVIECHKVRKVRPAADAFYMQFRPFLSKSCPALTYGNAT